MPTLKMEITKNLYKAVLFALFAITVAGAQTEKAVVTTNSDAIHTPDKAAVFSGGTQKFIDYFAANFIAPSNDTGDKIQIYVRFLVYEDGTLNEILFLKGFNAPTDQHIREVLENCPPWIPAEKDGEKVKSMFTLPISIPANPKPTNE